MKDELRDEIAYEYRKWNPSASIGRALEFADSILSLIDSQRCVWTKDAKITAFRTSCGKAHGLNWNFDYNPMCPGCGHQIEVKDEAD